jgi:hypothetical protein
MVRASRRMGYPGGVFEGSSLGRVRIEGGVREGTPDKDGYLRSKYRGRWYSHAEVVCMAWHGAPQVRHLGDGVTDNRPDRVCWGSKRQNEWDKGEEKEKRRKENGGYPPVPAVTEVTGGLQV